MVRFTKSSAVKAALTDPDVQLMLRVRAGDDAAFEALFRRYNERVQAVITYLMGNRQSTEDLAQEVFLRVYRARQNYVVGAKFSTWLFTIVNNVVSNARRSLARRREVNIVFDDSDGSHVENLWRDSSVDSPAQVAEHKELRYLVQTGVSQLGERQQAAVSLCDFVGMTYAGVAEELGTTPDAAKSLIHRGRMSLRKMLEPRVRCGDVF
ncbi:MAG TPA: RNA polymerase sigma factor [Pirellulaceae bacterium]|jgi:RNA polymerase sigma-70 factor (ECF subfamily)|nr:RNA polymerase sigma factor [Pirellulaceae bacterium]